MRKYLIPTRLLRVWKWVRENGSWVIRAGANMRATETIGVKQGSKRMEGEKKNEVMWSRGIEREVGMGCEQEEKEIGVMVGSREKGKTIPIPLF